MEKTKQKTIGLLAAFSLLISAGAAIWAVHESTVGVNAVGTQEGSYWSSLSATNGSVYGNSFRSALKTIMDNDSSKTNSYDALKGILSSSDYASSGTIHPFYRSPSESTANWNKEHVWPNSRGAGENAGYAGTDPQVIRPTNRSDNSSRSNYMYGETTTASWSNGWDPISISGYASARGEAARITFYAATKYYSESTAGAGGSAGSSGEPLELSDVFDNCSSGSSHKMGKLSYLMKWNDEYPVTAEEVYRNDYLDGQGYPRNPFIDHPDWANFIWSVNTTDNGGGTSSNNYTRTAAYTPAATSSSSSGAASSASTGTSVSTSTSVSTATSISSNSTGSSTSTSPSPSGSYTLVTSSSDLTAGSNCVLGYSATPTSGTLITLANSTITSIGGVGTNLAISSSYVTPASDSMIFTLEGSSGAWKFKTTNYSGTDGYLTYVADKTMSISSSGSTFAITISGNLATISPTSAPTEKLQYNSDAPRFTFYTSAQKLLSLYKQSNTVVSVTGVALSDSTLNLTEGGSTSTLTATVYPTNATNQNVSWSSSNENVATVTNGVVTPVGAGTATITVTTEDGSYTATCSVNVTAVVTLTSITVSGSTPNCTFGAASYVPSGLTVTAHYNNGSTADVTSSSTFGSPDSKTLGPQNPTVTYNGKTTTYAVKVTNVGAEQGSGSSSTESLSIVPNTATTGASGSSYISTPAIFTPDSTTFSINNWNPSTLQIRGNQAVGTSDTNFCLFNTTALPGPITKITLNAASSCLLGSRWSVATGTSSLGKTITGGTAGSGSSLSTSVSISLINTTDSYFCLFVNTSGATSGTALLSSTDSIVIEYSATSGSQLFTDEEQASAWSDYFLEQTNGNCSNTITWADLETEYNAMSATARAYFVSHESTTYGATYQRYASAVSWYHLDAFISGGSSTLCLWP